MTSTPSFKRNSIWMSSSGTGNYKAEQNSGSNCFQILDSRPCKTKFLEWRWMHKSIWELLAVCLQAISMLQVQGGEPRCSPAKPWSENTSEPGRCRRWYVWGRASKRESYSDRENDYKCLMSPLSLCYLITGEIPQGWAGTTFEERIITGNLCIEWGWMPWS